MGKRKYILLLTLLLPVILAVIAYLVIWQRKDVPIQQDSKPEALATANTEIVKTDSVMVDKTPIEITNLPQIIKPKIDSVNYVKKIVSDTILTAQNIEVKEPELYEEDLIISYQEEILTIDSTELIIPSSTLPEVTPYVYLTTRRVHLPTLFVPKGQWLFGGTISYTEHTNSNYKMLVIEDWDGAGYTISGKMLLGYAIKDNMALGAKIGFERSMLNIDNANLSLGDDLNFSVNNIRYINQQWSGTVFMRNYISLFKSRQFGLFNDTELTFGGGTSKMSSGTGDNLKGTYETIFKASIGISPGIIVFMHNIAAIEVSIGVLSFNTTSIKQITNQVYEGGRRTSGAKFGIDLLSIKLGGTIYLNSRKFKQR